MILLKLCLFLTITLIILSVYRIYKNKKESYLAPAICMSNNPGNPNCVGSVVRQSQELAEKQRKSAIEQQRSNLGDK